MKNAIAKHRSSSAVLVLDREVGLKNAARHVFPADVLPIVHCWNHMKREVRFKLTQLGVASDQKSYYLGKLEQWLKLESVDEFCEAFKESEKWPKTFKISLKNAFVQTF